ncbi:MAG: hypothetical protein J6E42_07065 [Firmicutes bacterium]|nr:hypothetical protein [Bacillota bacterium]
MATSAAHCRYQSEARPTAAPHYVERAAGAERQRTFNVEMDAGDGRQRTTDSVSGGSGESRLSDEIWGKTVVMRFDRISLWLGKASLSGILYYMEEMRLIYSKN